jgi:hypothetical protein
MPDVWRELPDRGRRRVRLLWHRLRRSCSCDSQFSFGCIRVSLDILPLFLNRAGIGRSSSCLFDEREELRLPI